MACAIAAISVLTSFSVPAAYAQVQPSQPTTSVVKPLGLVKAIAGNTITLSTDRGEELRIQIPESTRILQTAPGQKDLSNATTIALQDVQVGDRMLVRGTRGENSNMVVALSVIVMKGSEIAQRQEREREDWQKRGVAGLVKAVDGTNGTITVATSGFGSKTVAIHPSKETVIRRYTADSVKFDDAQLGTLEQIKPGDQLRARGTRSADGAEVAAEEIVSGSFRNISGTITSSDSASGTIDVMDLATKKLVTIKVTGDSQLKRLPDFVAQRIAMRLKGSNGDANADGSRPPAIARTGERGSPAAAGGIRAGGGPDLQQMVNRLPSVTVGDLTKGTAIMVVTTQGTSTSLPTAITLLTGVESILTASPSGSSAAMILSPWNLGGAQGDAATQ